VKSWNNLQLALFCTFGVALLSCKKYPAHTNYYLYSKTTRISNTWKLEKVNLRKNGMYADNTRVILNFQNKGDFTWLINTTSLGVESSILRQGNWKFIDRQSKIVLEEHKNNLMKRDTFQIISLTKDKLILLPFSPQARFTENLSFVME